MEISTTKSKTKIEKGIMTIPIYFISLCLTFMTLNHIEIAFILPICVLCFVSGYRFLLAYCLAVATSFLYSPMALTIAYMSVLFIILLQTLSFFKRMKTGYLPWMGSLLVMGYLYFINMNMISIGVIGALFILNSHLYLCLAPVIVHNELETYTKERMMILSIIVMMMLTSLNSFSTIYMMVILRFYVLLVLFYMGPEVIVPSLLYVSIILLMSSVSLKDDILSLILPITLFFLYRPKSKIICFGMYLASHIILPFFIAYRYDYYAFIVLISGFLFICAPSFKYKTYHLSKEYKDRSQSHQLMVQSQSFATLFQKLTDVFKSEETVSRASEFIGYVYEDVCSRCSSKDYCFYSQGGMSRLGKLIHKGIKGQLDQRDHQYIEANCIYPEQYHKSIQLYRQSYQKVQQLENENHHMRNNFFDELSLISNVFHNFSQVIEHTNTPEMIQEYLEAYHFQVVYLKKTKLFNGYTLELGMSDLDQQGVEEELVPMLNDYLNERIDIVSIKDAKHKLGYTSVLLKHTLDFDVEYGCQQYSLDKEVCGDAFQSFLYNNHYYLALCDGMGQGKKAREESQLTLEVVSQLITNGIYLKETMGAVNALLKIKNNGETYSTLDLCDFDLSKGVIKMMKYGAFTSYHIRNYVIDEILSSSLPMGIVSQIKMMSYEMPVKENDILIMVSDGVTDQFRDLLDQHIEEIETMHPQKIATLLMDETLNKNCLDDITILVIKMTKPQKIA